MNADLYLVTPKSQLAAFTFEADRQYFARPVRVELAFSCVATRQLYVTDPHRGHTYPVEVSFLKRGYSLTRRQLALIAA